MLPSFRAELAIMIESAALRACAESPSVCLQHMGISFLRKKYAPMYALYNQCAANHVHANFIVVLLIYVGWCRW